MKLTVLGCWAPYPRAGGACSGYLVQAKGRNILIECGNGIMGNILKYIDFRELDAVLISHLHPDHYLDLYCLRHAIEGARRLQPEVRPLPLYLPSEPAETYEKLKSFTEAFIINPIEKLTDANSFGAEVRKTDLAGVEVSFIRSAHPLPTYSITLEAEGKLYYSADTQWTEYLYQFAQGSDLCLCEASLIEKDRQYTSVGHLTCRQAGELARKAKARHLIATHIWPEYDLAAVKAETEKGFGGPVSLAHEGLQFEIK